VDAQLHPKTRFGLTPQAERAWFEAGLRLGFQT